MSLVADLWHFFRISALGATATLPLLGALTADRRLPARRAAGLIGVAACFHAFAYIHNDLCDLELDRGQPLRAAYPLVRGAIAPHAALAVALAFVPAAYALHALLVAPQETNTTEARRHEGAKGLSQALVSDNNLGGASAFERASSCLRAFASSWYSSPVALGAAFALLAAYNRWGKRCALPPLTDALQGAGWAALLGYGALAAGRPSRLTAALALYELLLIMLVNGVHGALRDLANDAAGGARTTALLLGASVAEDGGLRATVALAAYAAGLQAAMLAVLGYALAANLGGHDAAGRTLAAAGAGLSAAGVPALLAGAARGRLSAADAGMLHLILILSAPLALALPGAAPAPRAVLLAAHLAPLLINAMTYRALRGLLGGRPARPPRPRAG